MPEDQTANPITPPVVPTSAPSDATIPPVQSDTSAAPEAPAPQPTPKDNTEMYAEVTGRISDAQNVLIALSSDPSVDEMAAAIGLSLYLDKLGKRATAIYSGSTPNALEFLKPEETFEPSVDTLQDFVIALNKDKADHLRYKLDGDYVKIFITPYRTRISEDDLDFSYGDFNVDLVLALDVVNGIDLDSALREHGRIMHDATIINITTGNPGKFGEIEWSDKSASSVSEMIAKLLYSVNSKTSIEKEEATAFLTGIVAATNRFSNANTTPETMSVASRLMESGANQQLISKNITPDIENEMFSLLGSSSSSSTSKRQADPTKLDIKHGNEDAPEEPDEVDTAVTEKESTLLDDLKAAEASLAQTGAETTPDKSNEPIKIDSSPDLVESEPTKPAPEPAESPSESTEPISEPTPAETSNAAASDLGESLPPVSEPSLPSSESTSEATTSSDMVEQKSEKVVAPSADFNSGISEEGMDKYGKMLEDALAGLDSTPATPAQENLNPAASFAPSVSTEPEINGVPEINYMPMPGEEVLPPPPTPSIDMDASSAPAPIISPAEPVTPIEPATPVEEPTPDYLGPQPAMQDQVYRPQVSDPSAFKIPGM